MILHSWRETWWANGPLTRYRLLDASQQRRSKPSSSANCRPTAGSNSQNSHPATPTLVTALRNRCTVSETTSRQAEQIVRILRQQRTVGLQGTTSPPEAPRRVRRKLDPVKSLNIPTIGTHGFSSGADGSNPAPSRGESAANPLSPVTMDRPHRGPDYGSDHRNSALGQPCHHPSRRSSALSEPLARIAGDSPGARLADNGGEERYLPR